MMNCARGGRLGEFEVAARTSCMDLACLAQQRLESEWIHLSSLLTGWIWLCNSSPSTFSPLSRVLMTVWPALGIQIKYLDTWKISLRGGVRVTRGEKYIAQKKKQMFRIHQAERWTLPHRATTASCALMMISPMCFFIKIQAALRRWMKSLKMSEMCWQVARERERGFKLQSSACKIEFSFFIFYLAASWDLHSSLSRETAQRMLSGLSRFTDNISAACWHDPLNSMLKEPFVLS